MFNERFSIWLSGASSFSLLGRIIPRKTSVQAVSRHQVSQRFKSTNPFTFTLDVRRQAQPRISPLKYHKHPLSHPVHHLFKCVNQYSTNLRTDHSLASKMQRLSREYGWSALGVYIALCLIDFPFCFFLVKYIGSERIGELEQIVTSNLKSLIPEDIQRAYGNWRFPTKLIEVDSNSAQNEGSNLDVEHFEKTASNCVEESEKNHKKDASITAQLALAYAIHKSLIFIRFPLTAAITPKIVRTLRGWGWDIGKRTTKETKVLNRAKLSVRGKKSVFHKKEFHRLAKNA